MSGRELAARCRCESAGPSLDPGLARDLPQAVQALDSIQVSELTRLLGRAGDRGVARKSA